METILQIIKSMKPLIEIYYSWQSGMIIQLFQFFRFGIHYAFDGENNFQIIAFGIWKFDVSLSVKKDENAKDISSKWA